MFERFYLRDYQIDSNEIFVYKLFRLRALRIWSHFWIGPLLDPYSYSTTVTVSLMNFSETSQKGVLDPQEHDCELKIKLKVYSVIKFPWPSDLGQQILVQ